MGDSAAPAEVFEQTGLHLLNLQTAPSIIFASRAEEFSSFEGNFVKSCKWGPDASCLLSLCEDNIIRLHEGQEDGSLETTLVFQERDTVHDYCWFPGMSSAEPASACFIAAARYQPIHCWDAFTGIVRCSYRAYDQMDELTSLYSLCFNSDGSKIYAGAERSLRIFDTATPGRDCVSKTFPKKGGQKGIVSCLSLSPDQSVIASGSFAGSVSLYDSQTLSTISSLQCANGVTHIQHSPCGTYLLAGCRKSDRIHCWDIRQTATYLYDIARPCSTNQRIMFDIHPAGGLVVTGGEDGVVRFYRIFDGALAAHYQAANDSIGCAQFASTGSVMATASGQRRFDLVEHEDDEVSFVRASSGCQINVWQMALQPQQV